MSTPLFSILAVFTNLLLGTFVLIKGHRYPLARKFFALTVASAMWGLSDYLSITALSAETAWVWGTIRTTASVAALTVLVRFSLNTTDNTVFKKHPFLTRVLVVPILAVFFVRLTTHAFVTAMVYSPNGFTIVPGPYYAFPVAYGFFLAFLSCYIIFRKILITHDTKEKRNLTFLLLSVTFPLIGSSISYTILPRMNIDVAYLAPLFIAFMPLFVGISIYKSHYILPQQLFTGSIRAKVFAASLFSAFIIIIPGILFSYSSTKESVIHQVSQRINATLIHHQELIDRTFEHEISMLEVFSQKEYLLPVLESESKTSENFNNDISTLFHANPDLLSLRIFNKYAEPMVTIGDVQGNVSAKEINESISPYSVLNIKKNGSTFFYTIIFRIENSSLYIVTESSTTNYYTMLSDNHHSEFKTNELYLVNQQNNIISPIKDYDNSHLLIATASKEVQELCQSVNTLDSQFKRYTTFNNSLVLGNALQLSSAPWCIVYEVREDEALQSLQQLLIEVLTVLFLSLVAITGMSEFIGWSIGKPIEVLEAKTLELSKGHFDIDLDTHSNDEIASLSNSFKEMALSIKENRNNIAQKVKEQTSDIEHQKEILIKQQKGMVNILSELEEEKEKSDLLAQDLEKFQRAVANATDHIIITDKDGYIIYANKSVERITGFEPEDIIGQKAGSIQNWGGQMSEEFYKKLWDTIKVRHQSFSGELINKKKTGELYTVIATITPITGKDGDVQFFLGMERDVSKEKQIDQAKTEFVSLASHQLRTPLSAINWYTEMLLDEDAGKLNDEQKKYLHEIYTGNQRMVDLVTSLLNVSRLELGTFTIDPVPTALVDLAKDALKELQSLITEKHLIVDTKFDELPLIKVDKKLMYIIFQNLLSNACKYTPAHGKVLLSIEKQAKHVKITFADSGMGIPQEEHDKIFSKLYRANNAKESVTEGTGLGLYIVKSILDNAGGEITFESKVNIGTTFIVKLPITGMKKKQGGKSLT